MHHNKYQKKVIKVQCGFWCCQFLFVVLLSSTYWWTTCIKLSYYAKYQIRDSRLTTSSWICKLLSFGPMFIWKRLHLSLILLFGYDIDHIARTKKNEVCANTMIYIIWSYLHKFQHYKLINWNYLRIQTLAMRWWFLSFYFVSQDWLTMKDMMQTWICVDIMSLVVGSHSLYQSNQMKLFEDIKTWIIIDTIVNLSFHLVSQRFGY